MSRRAPEAAVVAALAALALGGCSTLSMPGRGAPNAQAAPVVSVAQNDTENLLLYADALRKMPREEFSNEISLIRNRVAQAPDNYNRIQLALALGMPNNLGRDPSKALQVLNDVTRDNAVLNPSLRGLVGYLQGMFALQVKQDEIVQQVSQRVREEQRRTDSSPVAPSPGVPADPAVPPNLTQRLRDEQKRAEALQIRHDEAMQALTQKLKDEQRRADLLQQKLDALTTIEKSLIERQKVKPDGSR